MRSVRRVLRLQPMAGARRSKMYLYIQSVLVCTCLISGSSKWLDPINLSFLINAFYLPLVNLVSTIVDEKSFGQLTDWIGKVCSFTVLYKAALNGCSSRLFHSLCDNQGNIACIKIYLLSRPRVIDARAYLMSEVSDRIQQPGPTLTVVTTRAGRVFGGYTSESWAGVDYKAAPRSFLFVLYSAHGKYTPLVFPGMSWINQKGSIHRSLSVNIVILIFILKTMMQTASWKFNFSAAVPYYEINNP
jgi:hypothetical protein